jgi:hypothetical protein
MVIWRRTVAGKRALSATASRRRQRHCAQGCANPTQLTPLPTRAIDQRQRTAVFGDLMHAEAVVELSGDNEERAGRIDVEAAQPPRGRTWRTKG